MHLAPLIRDLAIILGVAGVISLLFQRIRQPVVLGYILAGIVVGPYTPPVQLVSDVPSIQTWAELGVIFLMFTLGLEFSFRKLARVGSSGVMAAGAEVLFFLPVGYFVARGLGWSKMDGLFLGAMLAISSTTIIIKALEELKLKQHRFAELIFAALIVEDMFAILLLVALGTIATSQSVSALVLLTAALKLVLVVGGWFVVGYLLVPRFMRLAGRIAGDEVLTVVSLGLCLALVVFSAHFNYSPALGAFIMGSIIAESPVLGRVERSMASLRDVFGAVFFVSIGMLIDPAVLVTHWQAVVTICIVTIVGKILSASLGALISGQSIKTSLQVGFGLAQIGEFSFIIATLGLSLKATSPFLYPIAVAVSLVTTFATPYLIRVSGPAATRLERMLPHRLRETVNRYAAFAESQRSGTGGGFKSNFRPLSRWTINGLVASLIFVLISEWLGPMVSGKLDLSAWIRSGLLWALAAILSAPFVWAMLTAFRGSRELATLRIASKVLTVIWVAALSAEYFPGQYVALAAAVLVLVALFLAYPRLESVYRWFEGQFLSTFEVLPAPHGQGGTFRHLAPWDAHLVHLEIHPNSKFVMKRVSDVALRVHYGVNIVAIQRGRRSIVPPMPDDHLLPRDELVLLGTDQQIERLKADMEESVEGAERLEEASNYELRQLALSPGCGLAGQTIRESGIRERFHAMVVGLERSGERLVNPSSDMRLLDHDVLWVAGEAANLERLSASITAPHTRS